MARGFGGFSTVSPINRLTGKVALAINVRGYWGMAVTLRALLTDAILTVSNAIQTISRLNDSTPAGPAGGFTYIIKDIAGSLYAGVTGTLSAIATGLSTNPVSLVPFRPNTSVQPWDYLGDSSLAVTIPSYISSGYGTVAGMLKVRSDGLTRKMGVKEPQNAPTVTFPGGGSGPAQIFYKYVYRASETGALSNPGPVSIPGTNSQSDPSATQQAATGGVINPNISVNATQYEGNGTQIRTKGGVAPGTTTDYIIVHGFSLPTIPDNVNIDGIQIDLNWVGQNAGTGVLSVASLFYLGSAYGDVKLPGISNQSFSTDTLQGGNADTWGATLTPAIVNDPTFGFGVRITTQLVGGSDRSFVNSMGITVFYSTQDADITPTPSTDPQVDKIDFYRQGGGLANFTYVGTGPNSATTFNDQLTDLAASANPILQYDNFEPFPSIDLPRKGVLNAASNVLTWVSGDNFNVRWLPGTIILIGSPTQVAYTAVRRPSSTTTWDFTQNDPTVPSIPDGTNLVWNIAEPDLAAQPLPYLFGVTDNINFVFGVGDPLRPGTLYWCKGSNLDSAPDTNQMDVTDPSEPLVNGVMSGGRGVLFSIKRGWVIMPNFFNALATVTGTEGSTWTLQANSISRGLFIPRCIAVSGGGNIMFRVDDGIHISPGGLGSQSVTDEDLYNLFSHEGSTPIPVVRNGKTIYPPDDSQPQKQQISFDNGFWYYDFLGTDGNYHTLVYDEAAGGWEYDLYATQIITHSSNEGQSIQGVLAGCADHTLRGMAPAGTEGGVTGTVLTPAIGVQGWGQCQEVTVEYSSNATATLSTIAADGGNGSYGAADIALPSTGGAIAKTKFIISVNKWKLIWWQFSFTDPTFKVYTEGFAVRVKAWGGRDPFKQVNPFSMVNPFYSPQGGFGGEN